MLVWIMLALLIILAEEVFLAEVEKEEEGDVDGDEFDLWLEEDLTRRNFCCFNKDLDGSVLNLTLRQNLASPLPGLLRGRDNDELLPFLSNDCCDALVV